MFTVKDGLLYKNGEQVPYKPSPNHSGDMEPTLIVIHYTGDNSADGAISWLTSKGSGVSAHLVVRKDGSVVQLLPFDVVGWHAGKSEYDGRPSVNSFSIGIENCGTGDTWPDSQVQANREIIAALFDAYPIEDVVGHEEVAIPEGRKQDPGANYPWSEVVEVVK